MLNIAIDAFMLCVIILNVDMLTVVAPKDELSFCSLQIKGENCSNA